EARSGKNLKLGIEISRIISLIVQNNRAILRHPAQQGVCILEVNLDPGLRFVDVRTADQIDCYQGRNKDGRTDDQPYMFENDPPVISEVDVAFLTLIIVIASVRKNS